MKIKSERNKSSKLNIFNILSANFVLINLFGFLVVVIFCSHYTQLKQYNEGVSHVWEL